ncbi:MAG: (d)CMP kinase [Gemmatimonadota bacterium]
MSRKPVVTLDGPAGSGKSTTAKAVADALGFLHLDSGALYRALTFALLEADIPAERWPTLTADDFRELDVRAVQKDGTLLVEVAGRPVTHELRTAEVTEHVSRLAGLPEARRSLIGLQRSVGADGGLVTDGRDMGTVVFPDAEVKVFLVADLEERARRRLAEAGDSSPYRHDLREQVASIRERDRQDTERAHSPLREAKGAHRIDTTELDFDEQVREVVDLVRRLTPP